MDMILAKLGPPLGHLVINESAGIRISLFLDRVCGLHSTRVSGVIFEKTLHPPNKFSKLRLKLVKA